MVIDQLIEQMNKKFEIVDANQQIVDTRFSLFQEELNININ